MLWFHLFTEIKQQRNNLFLWSPMAFAFGIAATFAHGHWIGPALFIFLLICVLGYLGYYGVKDSAILPLLMLLFFTTCLLYTSPSPRDLSTSRMPSSA